MTEQHRNPGVEERIRLASDIAQATTCRRCGAAILTALAGQVAALTVRANPAPITPIEEVLALLTGRMTWHLVAEWGGVQRITWRHAYHIQAGPARHPVIADHVCPPRAVQGTLL